MIQRVTNPQTDADFLYQWAGMLFGIALPITVAFMVFQVIQSVLRARGFARSGVFSAVTGAALAVFGTAASLPIVHYLTAAVDGAADAMTRVIVGDIGTTLTSKDGATIAYETAGSGPAVIVISEALIDVGGGTAALVGGSAGCVLALDAASALGPKMA